MHEVTLGDRRRFTVQAPWGYTHMTGDEANAGNPRPVDTRKANYQTTALRQRQVSKVAPPDHLPSLNPLLPP